MLSVRFSRTKIAIPEILLIGHTQSSRENIFSAFLYRILRFWGGEKPFADSVKEECYSRIIKSTLDFPGRKNFGVNGYCGITELPVISAAYYYASLSCFLYSLGVYPDIFLNKRLMWCGYWKPTS